MFLLPEKNINSNNVCYNIDANELIKTIKGDLLYLDPPYNSRQYCDAYHLLEMWHDGRSPKCMVSQKRWIEAPLKVIIV